MISFLTLALVPTLAVSLARLTVGPVGSANHDATIVPLVVHGRVVHLFVCDDTPKTQQAVRRVEVVRIPGVRMHPPCE